MSKSDKHKTKLDSEKKSINKKSYTNINNSENKLLEIFKILPLLLIVGILPFVIRLKLIPLQGPFYEFWNGEKINSDFFTYYKQIFIYIVTVWALLHTFLFTKKIKFTKAYYFMGAYAVLVILSTIFSKYPQIALHGFVERREGMWIILCYLLLMFSAINLVETEKQIKAIIYTLGISGAVISIISIFQYFGMDIFTTEFAKNFMISKEIQAQIKNFTIQFGEKYSYGVFYNPNYLGGYISFYAPLMLSFAIISKNVKEKVLFAVFFILSIFALYGSRSEAGVLGTAGAIGLLILVLVARYILKDKPEEEHKKLLLTRFVPILLALIMLPLSLSYIPISENPLTRIRTEAVALFQPSDLKGKDYKEIGPINDIKQIDEQTIKVVVNDKATYINTDENSNLYVKNDKNNIIWTNENIEREDKNYKLDRLTDYDAYIFIKKGSEESTYGAVYYLRTYSGQLFFLINNGKIDITNSSYKSLNINKDLSVAKHMGFKGLGKLASNRGYIWSRSIPLVLDSTVLGKGQDTFIINFPQNDIFAKQVETSLFDLWTLTDKPHNLFIQIGIHSGLMSLITIIVGMIILIIISIKRFIFCIEHITFISIFISIFGFILSSIFNDSILAITPIVYILLGMNLSGIIKTKIIKAEN